MQFIGMNDRFGKSGEFEELMAYFGLDSSGHCQSCEKAHGQLGVLLDLFVSVHHYMNGANCDE